MSLKARLRRHERGHSNTGEAGQGLVEFALVLPFLLIVVFGIIDFGKAFGYNNDMTHLANEAARYAAVNSFPTGYAHTTHAIKDAVKDTAPPELQNGSTSIQAVTIVFTFPELVPATGVGHCIGDPVKVTVTSQYSWLPFLKTFHALPNADSPMTTSATMRLEKSYDSTNSANNSYSVPAADGTPACP